MNNQKIIQRSIYLYAVVLLLVSQSSCTSKPVNDTGRLIGKMLVLDYREFGPPQLSEEIIGPDYWQWKKQREHRPIQYDIKVIVYRNISLPAVKKRYPVLPKKKKDYRYVEYLKVTKWIDRMIKENQKDLIECVEMNDHDMI